MDITHEEYGVSSSLDDVLDRIQDVYGYISERADKVIRFIIEDTLIVFSIEGLYVNVYYRSKHNMFDRNCSMCKICVLDDDSIILRCYNGDKLVSFFKIM